MRSLKIAQHKFWTPRPPVSPEALEYVCLEYGNVVFDFVLVFLGYTLCNPNNVSVFLFLQFDKSVENTEVELLLER